MFRISKQLEISRLIRDCETIEEVCQWFRVLVESIGVQKARRLVANEFLTVKSRLDNQSIDKILSSTPITNRPGNNDTTKKHDQDSQIDTVVIARCELDSLSNGIIFDIVSYLPMKSTLNVSMTNHSFHK